MGEFEFVLLSQSKICELIVWSGFASTSTARDYGLDHFINPAHCVLFEPELRPCQPTLKIEIGCLFALAELILNVVSTLFKIESATIMV
jgi:hypothetical protein